MLDKSKSLTWYHIFSGILILRALSSLHGFASPSINASEAGVTVSQIFSLFPLTNILVVLNALVTLILHIKLFTELRRKTAACIRTVRILIFYFIALAVLSAIAGTIDYAPYIGSNDLTSYYASCVGMLLANSILLIPTYFYLKRRFVSPVESKPIPVNFDPFELVPVKLLGVSDQTQRDRIVAEIMRGNPNPYNGLPITNERDWKAYLQDEQTAQSLIDHDHSNDPHTEQTPPSSPESQTAPSDIPANSESIAPDAPLFCRFCGAALRSDNSFCERCGKSVK